jgi:hypothetical protein
MKNASLKTDRRNRRKPFKIDLEALCSDGGVVMTRAEFEEAKRRGPASLKTDRRKTAGTFVFPDEALQRAAAKPVKFNTAALRRRGVTVLTASDLKKAR